MSETLDILSRLVYVLSKLVTVLRNRHHGRMPEDVQRAYDAAVDLLQKGTINTGLGISLPPLPQCEGSFEPDCPHPAWVNELLMEYAREAIIQDRAVRPDTGLTEATFACLAEIGEHFQIPTNEMDDPKKTLDAFKAMVHKTELSSVPSIGKQGEAKARFEQWVADQDFTGMPASEIASLGFDAGHLFWHAQIDSRAEQLALHLRGRARFLRDKNQIKSPEVMEEAANYLDPVVEINPVDLRINTYHVERQSGWSTRSERGVEVIHIPTGITVRCHEDRSQHRNKAIAIENLVELLKQQVRNGKPPEHVPDIESDSYDEADASESACTLAEAHEWIRAALQLGPEAPMRFDYYSKEIANLRSRVTRADNFDGEAATRFDTNR